MDANIFIELWEKERKDRGKQQKFWDDRAQEFNTSFLENKSSEETEEVVNFLIKKDALKKYGTVLDIGCGPGKFSTVFALKAHSVIGTDISFKMIDFARKNAECEGLHNIQFSQVSWAEADLQELGWNKNFDLVFASFCPGIDSGDALKKMIDASRKHCFIRGFVTREDQMLDLLRNHFGIRKSPWGKQIYYSFNLLWNWGYYPEIIYRDSCWQKVYDIGEMADLFIKRIEQEVSFDRQDVVDYLHEISENGKIQEKTLSKVAWMYWQV